MAVSKDFSKGSVWKNVMAQAVPLTIASLIQLLYNIIDRMYIGHLPDADTLALTGIGLTFPIVLLVTAFTNLFGQGGVPLCAMARGAGDKRRAETIMGNSFTLLVLSGILLTVICYLFRKPVLFLFGASADSYRYADAYLKIYLIGTVFSMTGSGMTGYINAQGFPRVGMAAAMTGAILNIALDPLFIFGFHMGIAGAALATVISQIVSAVFVIGFLVSSRSELSLGREQMRLRASAAREISGLGLTGFVVSFTNCVVSIVCNSMLKQYGGDLFVGINTVLSSVREMIGLPVSGITNGAQPVISYNYGAGKYERVRKSIRFISIVGTIYTLFAWLLIFLFPEFFIRIFNDDAQLIQSGVPALHMYFFGFFMMAFQFSGQSAFMALGKAKHAVFFSVFRKVVIVVPLTLLLPGFWNLGVNGVFLAEPISNAVGGLACFLTMYAVVYRKLPADQ